MSAPSCWVEAWVQAWQLVVSRCTCATSSVLQTGVGPIRVPLFKAELTMGQICDLAHGSTAMVDGKSSSTLRCMQVASKLGLGSGGLGRLKRKAALRPSGDHQQSLDELQASPRGLLQTLSMHSTAQPRDEILGGELVVQVVEAQVASEIPLCCCP